MAVMRIVFRMGFLCRDEARWPRLQDGEHACRRQDSDGDSPFFESSERTASLTPVEWKRP
jgi:hypothetical protein